MDLVTFRVTEGPDGDVVTTQQFIDHARLNGVTVQATPTIIAQKLRAATRRAENYLRRALLPTKLEAYYTDGVATTPDLWLPRGEIRSIEAMTDAGYDPAQTITSGGYTLKGSIVALRNYSQGDVTVQYTAGYASAAAVPADIVEGILEYATVLFEDRSGKREQKFAASGNRRPLPEGVRELWSSYVVPVRV